MPERLSASTTRGFLLVYHSEYDINLVRNKRFSSDIDATLRIMLQFRGG